MKLYEKDGVKYFKFDNIEKLGFVNHCFSTRIGGVSEGCFESLNLGYSRGDRKEAVTENFRRICTANGMDYKKLVFGSQVHGNNIKRAGIDDCGCGVVFQSGISGFDGFVTNEPSVVLVTFHADCVPIFFADPVNKAIGLSHSGWKGTVLDMAGMSVRKMQEEFGSKPEDLICAIGPSIGKCCFEVDLPVADEFKNTLTFSSEYIERKENGKYMVDLWGINKRLLTKAGVKEENIEVTNECTKCSGGLFYSHRKMGDKRGSLAALMSIREF
ncbi:peptidoglycan editing factor PgeF [Anaerotignum faecicola]|nr:peptidoglycan editing factor PgeF [Anaerotignum faecicola]